MFKIVRIPAPLESFFEPFRSAFHWKQFTYFQELVLVMAFAWGRRNVSNLYRHLDPQFRTHRSRFNNFFLKDRWNPEEALRLQAYATLKALNLKSGDVVELVIDDSKKVKRGKAMEAVGWIHDSTSGKSMQGHQYVTAVLRFKGHTIPWGIRLYVKKEHVVRLKVEFQKLTQLAAQLIQEFVPLAGVKVMVLFDSFYLCPKVVNACREKGFRFASTLKGNRNLFQNGRKLKVGKRGRKLFRTNRKRHFTIDKEQGAATYDYVDAGWLDVSHLGRLHVIFSRKGSEPNILAIVTDDPTLSGEDIIKTYDHRWSIEVFFKDAKQLLGLGQYQNGTLGAAVIHLHLVCFAHALLTHVAILSEREKGKRKARRASASTGNLQNELRRMVWKDLLVHLKPFKSGDALVRELDRLLVAA